MPHSHPTSSVHRAIAMAAWLVPAAVFAASGLLKLIAPGGTMPQMLAALLEIAPQTVWMRTVGGIELLVAALVVWPASRRPGLWLLVAITTGFSLLVAWSAADLAFIGDCGCFGRVGSPGRYHGWILLRNGLLILVATIGLWRHVRQASWRRAIRVAVITAALATLAPGLAGEMKLREAAYRELGAATRARHALGGHGQPLPDFELHDRDGHALPANEALRAFDQVVFVSRNCPHCQALGPALRRHHEQLAAENRRVVLILVGTREIEPDWLARMQWEGLPVYAAAERGPLLELGIDEVPRILQLDARGRVEFNEAHPVPTSLWKTLATIERRVPGAAPAFWESIAEGIFGAGCRPQTPPELAGEAAIAAVEDPTGRPCGQLVVVQDGWRPADTVELAVGIDGTDRIAGIVPLAAGAYARLFTPEMALVDSLVGLELAAADSLLVRHAKGPSLERPVWQSLRRALQRVPPAIR